MGRTVTVATCALNQWALDFDGNLERIFKSKPKAAYGAICKMQLQRKMGLVFVTLQWKLTYISNN